MAAINGSPNVFRVIFRTRRCRKNAKTAAFTRLQGTPQRSPDVGLTGTLGETPSLSFCVLDRVANMLVWMLGQDMVPPCPIVCYCSRRASSIGERFPTPRGGRTPMPNIARRGRSTELWRITPSACEPRKQRNIKAGTGWKPLRLGRLHHRTGVRRCRSRNVASAFTLPRLAGRAHRPISPPVEQSLHWLVGKSTPERRSVGKRAFGCQDRCPGDETWW